MLALLYAYDTRSCNTDDRQVASATTPFLSGGRGGRKQKKKHNGRGSASEVAVDEVNTVVDEVDIRTEGMHATLSAEVVAPLFPEEVHWQLKLRGTTAFQASITLCIDNVYCVLVGFQCW